MKKSLKYKDAKVWVQNIPHRKMQKEYLKYLKKRKTKINQSIRKSQRCISNTIKKKQCKKRTAHTPKCWIHLAKEDNLRIKPSNIKNAGKGLFAWKKFIKPWKLIGKYTGKKKSQAEINTKYGAGLAEYALCDQGNCIDANYTTNSAPRFVNDPRGSRYSANSNLTGNGRIWKFV